MRATWRLVVDAESSGARNMAIDRAMQLCREMGAVPPTLRLYRWADPTVSLGRFQKVGSVDTVACEELGIDVVRRVTGGRGVLHDDEVTYSVVASVSDRMPRAVATSYRHISAGLVAAYRFLGVNASITERSRGERNAAACYLHASRADLSLGVGKLAGSAQVWHGDTCLQHGSITRARDVEREARIFGLSAEQTRRLSRHAITLQDALGEIPSVDRIVECTVEGFARALGVEFQTASLDPAELQIAAELEPGAGILSLRGRV